MTNGRAQRDNRVEIVPYSERWPADFARVGRGLREALGDLARRIDHIGSTAVQDLPAKDVIDVQIAVSSLETEVLRTRLESAGYELVEGIEHDHRPPGTPGEEWEWRKLLFRERPPARRINVHVRVEGAPNARYALLFRDYLRANRAAASAYGELKRRLAAIKSPIRPDEYTLVKDPACDLIIAAAEAWAREAHWRPGESDA